MGRQLGQELTVDETMEIASNSEAMTRVHPALEIEILNTHIVPELASQCPLNTDFFSLASWVSHLL